jgi:hypothetical protein
MKMAKGCSFKRGCNKGCGCKKKGMRCHSGCTCNSLGLFGLLLVRITACVHCNRNKCSSHLKQTVYTLDRAFVATLNCKVMKASFS